jgi:hypothetical protein
MHRGQSYDGVDAREGVMRQILEHLQYRYLDMMGNIFKFPGNLADTVSLMFIINMSASITLALCLRCPGAWDFCDADVPFVLL